VVAELRRVLVVAACSLPGALTSASDVREETEDALEVLGVAPRDQLLSFDTVPRDPYRLALIDSLLEDPLALPAFASRFDTAWAGPTGASAAFLDDALRWLDFAAPINSMSATALPEPGLEGAIRSARLPASQARTIGALAAAARAADIALEQAPVPAELVSRALGLLDDEEGSETQDPFTLREAERAALLEADAVYDGALPVDRATALRVAGVLLRAIDAALAPIDSATTSAWVPFEWTGDRGRIVVGSRAADAPAPNDALVYLDLGGNDHYRSGAGGTGVGHARVRVAIDLGGDDVYEGSAAGTLAAGVGGIGVLVDLRGDDVYRGKIASIGAGLLGVGVLVDRAGNDFYEGAMLGQGAAMLGAGALFDEAGHDTYRMGLYGQGFGGVGGVGVLRDFAGGDRYLATPLVVDVLRYEEHYNSFLQGAAFGARPDRSGGIGLLVDDRGNDLYDADIFGQGTAYWFALGILRDRAGHDVYAGYQYAQGAGIHYGLGLLSDAAGEDTYRARGVSQGCGHDRGAGFLVDDRGNDAYVAFDLSQGAGSANGAGVLVDRSGRDAYLVRATENSMGYGNPRNGSGSVGLFLDRRGDDAYAAAGRDSSFWWGSAVGAGLDDPDTLGAGEVWPEDPKVPVSPRAYSIDELFTLASMGPPKFSKLKEYGIAELASQGPSIAPSLLRYFDSRIPREQLGLKDVFQRMGEPVVPFLSEVADTASTPRARAAVYCLGEIGTRSALPALCRLLARPGILRAEAALAVGKIVRKSPLRADADEDTLVAHLVSHLGDPSPSVRRSAAFAIGGLAGAPVLSALVGALDDPFVGARLAAWTALVSFRDRATPALAARIGSPGIGRAWALHVLEGSRDPGAARALRRFADDAQAWTGVDRIAFAKAVAGHPEDPELLRLARGLANDPEWRVAAAVRGVLR